MLNKLLDLKVPTMFDDHQHGTIGSEWQAYLFMIALFAVPVLLVIAYFKYWI